MRYAAKIHVIDVMDQVVVSGYVYGYNGLKGESPEPVDFSYSVPGMGIDEPMAWLLNAVYRAVVTEQRPLPSKGSRGRAMGGPNTISETGDRWS